MEKENNTKKKYIKILKLGLIGYIAYTVIQLVGIPAILANQEFIKYNLRKKDHEQERTITTLTTRLEEDNERSKQEIQSLEEQIETTINELNTCSTDYETLRLQLESQTTTNFSLQLDLEETNIQYSIELKECQGQLEYFLTPKEEPEYIIPNSL